MVAPKNSKEPLIHITKRGELPAKKALLIRLSAVLSGLLLCSFICSILFDGANPFNVILNLVSGNFGTPRRIWIMLRDTSLLLLVGLALLPAFKMKFWNLGGNGQILVGALATIACMYYMGGTNAAESKVPNGVIVLCSVVLSVAFGALWAVIPAIFKSYFKTNESLFTLMMNYIASGLVAYFISVWDKSGHGKIDPLPHGRLPVLGNAFILSILVAALVTAAMFVYNKYSKHGFEVAVVGESENTARYVGMDVKKVVIRTMALSGALCGLVGLLLAGSMEYAVSDTTAKNMGFTAIMVAWLAKFNPLVMVLTAFFVTFVSKGMSQVQTAFGITNDAASNIMVGIIFFCVIGCEFFISYKVHIRGVKKPLFKKATPTGNRSCQTQEKEEK